MGETFYSLIPSEYLLLDTNYFFSCDNPYGLLGLLNSQLITWWINSEDTQIGGGGAYRHYKYNLEKLSVPKQVSNLFKDIDFQSIKQQKYVDLAVCDLYDLTKQEIDFIESQQNQ